MLGLVRTFDRHAEILGLLLGQLRQFHADLLQMQARDFFVELLAQNVDADFVGVFVPPEIELGEHLVGERVRHDEARVAGGAAEIHEPAFRQHENLVAVGEGVFVDLRFDVRPLDVFAVVERIDLNLVIEMADVRDNRLVLHPLHVVERDDVDVAGGGDVDVAPA